MLLLVVDLGHRVGVGEDLSNRALLRRARVVQPGLLVLLMELGQTTRSGLLELHALALAVVADQLTSNLAEQVVAVMVAVVTSLVQ